MITSIPLDGNNPYLNDPCAWLKAPPSQIMHEGKLYTKLSYELKVSAAKRLIKIIQFVAIAIFTCLIALSFQSIRKLWLEGIKVVTIDILLLQSFSENTDIWMIIASSSTVKDLIAMQKTSIHKRFIAKMTLINHLNAGTMTPADFGISTVTGLIDFFGMECSKMTRLDLQNFQIHDTDLKKTSDCFTNIKCLLLNNNVITNESSAYLEKMTFLTTLNLSGCKKITDFSFLEQCKGLKTLNLERCTEIKDFNFLVHCSNLTHLNLSDCGQINDISFLEHCKNLIYLNLSDCKQINDMSILEHCKELTSLFLNRDRNINDFTVVEHLKNLTTLSLIGCNQITDTSFFEHCKNLITLDLKYCIKINDFRFLQQCNHLRNLSLTGCYQIHDFSFLQYSNELTSLNLTSCGHIDNLSFLQYCRDLESLNLTGCNISDLSFLQHCKKLTNLDLSGWKQLNDLSFLEHCPKLTSIDLTSSSIGNCIIQYLRTRGLNVIGR